MNIKLLIDLDNGTRTHISPSRAQKRLAPMGPDAVSPSLAEVIRCAPGIWGHHAQSMGVACGPVCSKKLIFII